MLRHLYRVPDFQIVKLEQAMILARLLLPVCSLPGRGHSGAALMRPSGGLSHFRGRDPSRPEGPSAGALPRRGSCGDRGDPGGGSHPSRRSPRRLWSAAHRLGRVPASASCFSTSCDAPFVMVRAQAMPPTQAIRLHPRLSRATAPQRAEFMAGESLWADGGALPICVQPPNPRVVSIGIAQRP